MILMIPVLIFTVVLLLTTYSIPYCQVTESLLDALVEVESNGNPTAIGDGGKAHGCLQLHKIYIEDVNRIYGTNYAVEDAYECETARTITRLYLEHYCGTRASAESYSRLHNSGPGWKRKLKSTDNYWRKVKVERCQRLN